MSGVLEGMEDSGTVAMGEIEFTRGVGSEVVGDDAIDFGAEGLNSD